MLVSVTTVMDYLTEQELLAWMLRTPKAKREQASKDALIIGKIVDQMIQDDLFPQATTSAITIPPEFKVAIDSCMSAWRTFKETRPDIVGGIKGIQLELKDDEIIGHPDILFDTPERWGIIDVKTSKAMYPRYWTQTAKYADLYRRTRLKWPTGEAERPFFIGVLRLDKESGTPYYMEVTNRDHIDYEIEVFNAYKIAYDHNYKNREFIRQQLEMEILK